MLVNSLETSYSYLLVHQDLQHNNIKQASKIEMDDFNLFYSHDMDVIEYKDNQTHLVAFGYMLDIRNSELTGQEILSLLANSKQLDRELDYINGRYVLFVKKLNEIFTYTDASALMPINYAKKHKVVSSHDIVIAEILKDSEIEVKKLKEVLVGTFDYTRYIEIFKFNPSLKLNLKTWSFERYYPHNELEHKSVDFVLKELELYFDQMIKWLKKYNGDIILTLTGGYDSRVSMALTNSISEKVEYITYIHPNLQRLSERAQEIYDVDKYITESIGYNLNVNHTMVDLADYNLSIKEKDHGVLTLQTTHSYSLIDYFRNHRKFKKALHIKSTVYGMGKSDFPLIKNHNPQTFEEMTEFIHGVSKEATELYNYATIIKDYYKRNLQTEGVTKGRHFFELFHLESRMGNWHSNVTQETDPELLDFIFVNTRRIIDLLQSPSIQERRDKVLYKKIINKYWPALLFIGVNEKTINVDYDKIGMNHTYINGLKIYELTNLDIQKSDHNCTITPSTEFVGPQFQYVFKAKNNTHDDKVLKLSSMFNKENGRKYINVRVMKLDNKTYKTIDIVDLYNGYEVTLEPFQELMIRIDYIHVFENESWLNAGRVKIQNI